MSALVLSPSVTLNLSLSRTLPLGTCLGSFTIYKTDGRMDTFTHSLIRIHIHTHTHAHTNRFASGAYLRLTRRTHFLNMATLVIRLRTQFKVHSNL